MQRQNSRDVVQWRRLKGVAEAAGKRRARLYGEGFATKNPPCSFF